MIRRQYADMAILVGMDAELHVYYGEGFANQWIMLCFTIVLTVSVRFFVSLKHV